MVLNSLRQKKTTEAPEEHGGQTGYQDPSCMALGYTKTLGPLRQLQPNDP